LSKDYKLNNRQHWRDRQLNGFNSTNKNSILEQEKVMLDFVTQFSDIKWLWLGDQTNFQKICKQHITIDNIDYQGVILFGSIMYGLSTNQLVERVRELTYNIDFAYVGINRYWFTKHDIDIELPDSIAESLDVIMNYCEPKFKRLHSFEHVDGNHLVAAHPRDCYGLCRL
jgi:hypothetical protein